MAKRGIFITFEGGEGAGKTTQVKLLAETLKAKGYDVLVTREPGGCPEAEAIRELLLHRKDLAFSPLAQVLMITAGRYEHVTKVIVPAIRAGKIVLCDRFLESTLVYQGAGMKLDIQKILRIHIEAIGPQLPHLTVLLDIPPYIGIERAAKRGQGGDKIESLPMSFHNRLRDGYLKLSREGKHIAVVKADQDQDAVQQAIHDVLKQRLGINL